MEVANEAWVGRAEELSQLDRAWARSRRGLKILAVTGEPGIGKTRLATEFLARLTDGGSHVLRGHCEQYVDVAHAPFLDMLRVDIGGLRDEDLHRRLGP